MAPVKEASVRASCAKPVHTESAVFRPILMSELCSATIPPFRSVLPIPFVFRLIVPSPVPDRPPEKLYATYGAFMVNRVSPWTSIKDVFRSEFRTSESTPYPSEKSVISFPATLIFVEAVLFWVRSDQFVIAESTEFTESSFACVVIVFSPQRVVATIPF